MREIDISVENLINSLLVLSENEPVFILDSCGAKHLGSHLLIAGIRPRKINEFGGDANEILAQFEKESSAHFASIFTISYDLGLKLNRISSNKNQTSHEPDVFAAFFDSLIVYDYDKKRTFLVGNDDFFSQINDLLISNSKNFKSEISDFQSSVRSNFSKTEYLKKIEQIKELIRSGDTYQTNLTQRLTADLPPNLTPQKIFLNLRKNHPAPFAAFLKRSEDFVVSASPERFFQATIAPDSALKSIISTSPIKGTRRRGNHSVEDEMLKNELLDSAKDRAENIMIVDLLRNDLGRVCKFGSVRVEKLCDLEEHPTLFHLVSTVAGELRETVGIADVLKAVFPCGSITGAPKIRTMQIIEKIETASRGLSMGAIGFSIFNRDEYFTNFPRDAFYFDLSVAIRTMVIKNNRAVFNVGGGIVIDSDADDEYEETLTKAQAILSAINGEILGMQFAKT